MKEATVEELKEIMPEKIAKDFHDYLMKIDEK